MAGHYTRREILRQGAAALGAVATSAAGRALAELAQANKPPAAPSAPVAIQRCDSYDREVLLDRLKSALDALGGIEPLVRGKTVTIKLNLTGGPRWQLAGLPAYRTYHVHPHFVAATCAALQGAGAQRIVLLESGLPRLRAQGGGQVVAITSVAGSRGMPYLGGYSAAKAGLHRYVQALRAEVRHEPIVVTELAPGYIDTDMNRSAKRRPFVIPQEEGGAMIARMIERGVAHRYVPMWPWALVAPLLKLLPTRLVAPPPRKK